MHRIVIVGSLLVAFCVSTAGPAWGQKKPDVVNAGPTEFAMLAKFADIPAQFRSANTKTGKVVVRIENTVPTKDQAKLDEYKRHQEEMKQHYNQMEHVQKEMNQAQRQIRNPKERSQRINQLQQQLKKHQQEFNEAKEKSNPRRYMETTFVDFELALKENAAIRKMAAPDGLSAEEKLKLKGKDRTLPGYTATLEELTAGSPVKVYIEIPKAPAESPASTSAEAKPATSNASPEGKAPSTGSTAVASSRPIVRMIVLYNETPKTKKK